MTKIGITEAGDAGLDFSWVEKLCEINIIITKHLTCKNTKLIKLLLENSEKIILHCTCTGYGSTKMEPNVPKPSEVFEGLEQLINKGFPVSQIVLRTDPIIPTTKGIEKVESIWSLFSNLGIERCRFSIIDMYPHTKRRIKEAYGTLPFETFSAPQKMIYEVEKAIERNKHLFAHFESCAEKISEQVGCISKKDFDILDIPFENVMGGFQRKGCLCCAGKTELLCNKKKCPSGCLYCYWKD